MIYIEDENDTLYQDELNEIKINENNEIFEVPGQIRGGNPLSGFKSLCNNV